MSQEAVAAAQPRTVASSDTDPVVLANMVAHMGLRAGRALNALHGHRRSALALWSNRRSTGCAAIWAPAT